MARVRRTIGFCTSSYCILKIDRRNPLHWLYLAVFATNVLAALALRPLLKRSRRPVCVLYGHKFSGNLKAIYEHAKQRQTSLEMFFLTLDPAHFRELRASGIRVVSAISPGAVLLLARAAALVSDHGLHVMGPLLRWSDIRFFDVWHGIPFKGFDADDFKVQHRYDETWVASPLLAELYVKKFGFAPQQVITTGYARTDRLVKRTEDTAAIRAELGVPAAGPLILFAPTWVQDDKGRSLYPFGHSESEFLRALSDVAGRHGATVMMRAHLNSGDEFEVNYANVVAVPQGRFPDTEAVLLVSDVLICDWSSIAFDYLVLERPTLFLDVPPPFRKGFSLGPEHRFGSVVPSLRDLIDLLHHVLIDQKAYLSRESTALREAKQKIYGDFADGNAAARCLNRLTDALLSA